MTEGEHQTTRQEAWPEHMRAAFAFGAQTIKSLEIVNGGAAIAILTFYGNVLSRSNSAFEFNRAALTASLLFFGLGVLSAVLCSVFAYISQLQTARLDPERLEAGMRMTAFGFGLFSALLFGAGVVAAALSFG